MTARRRPRGPGHLGGRARSPHLGRRASVRPVDNGSRTLETRRETYRRRRSRPDLLLAVMAIIASVVAVSGAAANAETETAAPDDQEILADHGDAGAAPSTTEPSDDEPTPSDAPESSEPSETSGPPASEPPESSGPPESNGPPGSEPSAPPESTGPPGSEPSAPPESTGPPASDPPEPTEPPEPSDPPATEPADPPESDKPPESTGPAEPPGTSQPTPPPETTTPPAGTQQPTTVPHAPPAGGATAPGSTGDDDAGDASTPDDTVTTEGEASPAANIPADEPPVEPAGPLPEANTQWSAAGSPGRLPAGEPGASLPMAGRVPAVTRWQPADDVEVILATIRELESGGRYHIGPNRAGASGAYQFIPSTWSNYQGYQEAYLAPPRVQDARARADVTRFLAMHDGDVALLPVLWYYPRAVTEPVWMDRVPNPAGGNVLTVREYQQRWLQMLQRKHAEMHTEIGDQELEPAEGSVLSEIPESVGDDDQVAVSDDTLEAAARSAPPDELPPHGRGSQRSIVFPVLGPVTYHDGWGDCRDGCSRRHEGTDMIGVRMQPLLAAVDGTVHTQRYESKGTAGVVLSIVDDQGWRYNYFHLNNDTPGTDDGQATDEWRFPTGLAEGDRVRAGQIVGYMGDSGNSEDSVPHLHFEFRDPSGNARPSYWSIAAAEARQACTIGLGPWSSPSPASGPITRNRVEAVAEQQDAIDRGVEMTTVTPLYGDGHWLIDTEGRVTASGDAALIIGARELGCDPGPLTPYGADAAGWHTEPDTTILTGTSLENSRRGDGEALGLAQPTSPGETDEEVPVRRPASPRWPEITIAYRDPSTGETVIVPRPSR